MSSRSNSSNNTKDDGQDTSAAAPVEDGVDQTQADDPTDNVGEDTEVKHAETDTEDSLRHNMSDDGAVIGRRNPDLPTEVQD